MGKGFLMVPIDFFGGTFFFLVGESAVLPRPGAPPHLLRAWFCSVTQKIKKAYTFFFTFILLATD